VQAVSARRETDKRDDGLSNPILPEIFLPYALSMRVWTQILVRSEGADLLWLTAWTGNTSALRFYEAQGYQDLGDSGYTFEGDCYETRVLLKRLSL